MGRCFTMEKTEAEKEECVSRLAEQNSIPREEARRFCAPKKYELERAQQLYENYKNLVQTHSLASVSIKDAFLSVRKKSIYIPERTDRNGAALLVVDPLRCTEKILLERIVRILFYFGEILTKDCAVQEKGVTLVFNMDGMTPCSFSFSLVRKITSFFQESFPAKVKNILFHRPPCWLSFFTKLARLFMKQKACERIKLCSDMDMVTFVDLRNLPVEFGGELDFDAFGFISRRSQLEKIPAGALMMETREERQPHVSFVLAEEPEKDSVPSPHSVLEDELEKINKELRENYQGETPLSDAKIDSQSDSLVLSEDTAEAFGMTREKIKEKTETMKQKIEALETLRTFEPFQAV
ncbi:MAG: uncharacterized protein A8A55_0584 [Amphiamblys sp. WSBS2006]|nr:MAG: uncharacterized protein A8A55_0584 [Amphiamblys sp. WSBS2006]